MISFPCPACGQTLKVKDDLAGKKGRCPHCQQPVAVPSTLARLVAAQGQVEADARTRPPEAGPTPGQAEAATCASDAPQCRTIPPGAVPAGASREHYDFLSPPQQPDELGRLGPYRVLKVLGAGGMGVVFQAEDPSLDRKVALKAMLPTLAASESARQRFLREAKAAAAIEHDHIVPIFQVGQDRGVPFIAMPFLKGMPLDERLRREPILPLAETLRIGRETAKGLAAAHEAGLIHRDVKPANLWLEGTQGRVKILDFGLARAAADTAQLTQAGAIMGTPAYMAPEQANGKPVDARSDLFALGCVLYRLCTGEMPFKGPDAISTLMAVTTEQPESPAEVNPAIPPALSNLVMRLLAKNPGDRPASAVEVIREIQAIEVGRSEKEQPDTEVAIRPDRRRPPARAERPWLWSALTAGLLALAVVAAVIVIQATRDRGEGTVTIETVDPDVEVVVSGNGRSFTIKDRKTKQEVTLPVGKYEVELKGGKGGLKLETPSFTLKRGKQEVVRVTWQERKPPPGKVPPAKAVFKPLFNGKDLTGWEVYPKGTGQWKVEEGLLIGSGPASHLFSERGDYKNFHFRVEAMINDKGNSGQYFRAKFGPGFPRGWEAQINATHGDRVKTGSLYPDAREKGLREIEEIQVRDTAPHKPDEWFTQEVICKGARITILVNGKKTVDWTDPNNRHKTGHFALQQHDPGTVVKFRKIEVKELPDE